MSEMQAPLLQHINKDLGNIGDFAAEKKKLCKVIKLKISTNQSSNVQSFNRMESSDRVHGHTSEGSSMVLHVSEGSEQPLHCYLEVNGKAFERSTREWSAL